MCVSETWLNDGISSVSVQIEGYNFYRKDRVNPQGKEKSKGKIKKKVKGKKKKKKKGGGGGVGIYVKDYIDFKPYNSTHYTLITIYSLL